MHSSKLIRLIVRQQHSQMQKSHIAKSTHFFDDDVALVIVVGQPSASSSRNGSLLSAQLFDEHLALPHVLHVACPTRNRSPSRLVGVGLAEMITFRLSHDARRQDTHDVELA